MATPKDRGAEADSALTSRKDHRLATGVKLELDTLVLGPVTGGDLD